MQIQRIKISNILSFPYLEDFDNNEGVIFNLESNSNSVNILIGPNGSGKSNFLFIINQILKCGLMKDYIYDNNYILNKDKDNFKKTIISNDIFLDKIFKHSSYKNKESKISIKIKLSNNDIDNIGFVSKYIDYFNHIIDKYSYDKITLEKLNTEEISLNREIEMEFEVDIDNKKLILNTNKLSNLQKNIINHIKSIELIQIAIIIHNQFEYKESKYRSFYPLKNNFSFIGLHRNFQNISHKIDPKLRNDYISDKNIVLYEPFVGYYLCINKIRNILNHTSNENINITKDKKKFSLENIEKKLENSDFFSNLKLLIKIFFDKNLMVGKENEDFYLYLVDNYGQSHEFKDLSNGEQSLLIIIFSIYGFDLKNGIILINEPEIHFHPQMQKSLIKLLERISENLGTQFIISTYSSLFINEKNISNVYKFTKINGETIVTNPGTIGTDESSLIQILKFDNVSKIFFSNRIIMVEGEIDAYFFDFYIKYLRNYGEFKNKIGEYEIININGKGSFKRRKKFLSKFGLKSYFIGDWDNTVDFGILNQMDLNHYYQSSKKYYHDLKKNKLKINNHYARVVNTVKNISPNKYNYIVEKIERLYSENVFILKMGDIETYLGIRSKGLEDTINFCHRHFHERLIDNNSNEHRKELDNIINIIFSD